ncbi:MAG: diguanylate cyclase, partial [Acidobacteriota bacterium]
GRVTNSSSEVVIARLLSKIATFNKKSKRPYQLSVSLGLVPIDLSSQASLDDIIDEADKAMYKNKRAKAEPLLNGRI